MRAELVPITFIIVAGIVALSFLKMLAQGFSRRQEAKNDPEETRLIQEMHRNLTRLEDRIESLETLIVDRERVSRRDLED